MSHQRPHATIKQASSGAEWLIFVNDSYRMTISSEHEARAWCKRQGIDADAIEVARMLTNCWRRLLTTSRPVNTTVRLRT